jgi:zona occludens toxin
MITLVTGLPGHGKTLFAVSKIARTMLQSGRPVYSNINGLRPDLGVHPLPAGFAPDFIGPIPADNFVTAVRSWLDVPSGSIVVIDECQAGFPPRSSGAAVPSYIRAFETHRHFGLDVWLITQHPRFIDLHLARLVDTHFHVERFGGLAVSTIREYAGINFEPAGEKLRSDGLKTRFRFRKEDFALYQSAVGHFVKVRLPRGTAGAGAGLLHRIPL